MASNNSTSQSTNPYRDARVAVVGMGVTGRSCVRFLIEKDADITVYDKRNMVVSELLEQLSLPRNAKLKAEKLVNTSNLNHFDYVVLSPGVSLDIAAIRGIKNRKCIISDLDIFAQFNKTPCIGVSGSNGKSTVVDLLHRSLLASGYRAQLGGNFGKGALDLLAQDTDYIVLELSSFQLEITQKLPLEVACILNVTEDHIDRHQSFAAYAAAKNRIFEHAHMVVVNTDDANTQPQQWKANNDKLAYSASVSPSEPANKNTLSELDFWQDERGIYQQDSLIIRVASVKMPLKHMLVNMQFVLAIVSCLRLPLQNAIAQCKQYEGLPHRFEFVAQRGKVQYINDSKATNPGACVAAIQSAKQLYTNIILIAGGDAKGADLSGLEEVMKQSVKWCVVYGKDAQQFLRFGKHVVCVADLETAIEVANLKALELKEDTLILLSPACASIDMFNNYIERGNAFKKAILGEAA